MDIWNIKLEVEAPEGLVFLYFSVTLTRNCLWWSLTYHKYNFIHRVICPTPLHGVASWSHTRLAKYSPSLIIKEVWLVSLYNDNIKKISPVLSNYELHTLVPTESMAALIKYSSSELTFTIPQNILPSFLCFRSIVKFCGSSLTQSYLDCLWWETFSCHGQPASLTLHGSAQHSKCTFLVKDIKIP